MTKQIKHLINHIALIIDESGSMMGKPVPSVVDKEIENIKNRAKQANQETRISIFVFNTVVSCNAFDLDISRFVSMGKNYRPGGQTALIDATIKGIEDLEKIPEVHGDHAFLIYVITDGEENASRNSPTALANKIASLSENWTVACLVPSPQGVFEAKRFGFPADSIAQWDIKSETAFEDVGAQFTSTYSNYMNMRSTGVRGTKGLFTLDSANLKKSHLKSVKFDYSIYGVDRDGSIRDIVEELTGKPYAIGSTFYQPVKPVKIQDYKEILAMNRTSGDIYGGGDIRQALGLPPQTVEVNPGHHKDWKIFVQSTSTNRKLFEGTEILVRKY